MYEHVHELHIPNKFGSEKIVMEQVATLAKKIGFSDDRIEDLKTAVSEACLNAIEHGNEMNATTKVGISLSVNGTKMKVSVEDKGNGMRGKMNEPNIDNKINGTETPRGWGIFLIKNLMDDIKFEPKADGGNVTTMIIHLDKNNKR
jgi:serine/threonine-protein kinase RsbW